MAELFYWENNMGYKQKKEKKKKDHYNCYLF